MCLILNPFASAGYCQKWSVRKQAGLGDEQVLDSIMEAIKAKKAYWSHFAPGALNFQWNKILEKSIDLPFLLCCTGDEDQRRFVLFYAQRCNLNLYFHPDSHNFAECTALSAHTLPNLVPPFVTVLRSQLLPIQRNVSPPLLLPAQETSAPHPAVLSLNVWQVHWPTVREGAGLLSRGLFKRDPRSEQFLKH